jgi:hypothetical protein
MFREVMMFGICFIIFIINNVSTLVYPERSRRARPDKVV